MQAGNPTPLTGGRGRPASERVVRAATAEPAADTDAATDAERDVDRDASTRAEPPWVAIVWNDPVNLMSYVTYVFHTLLGHPRPVAHRLMLDVHHKGRATVSRGTRDEMEVAVTKLQSAGLWATMAQGR